MTRTQSFMLTAAAVVALGAAGPADAGGSFAFGISSNGVSVGIGTSNWGIWGSSWDTGGAAVGFSTTLAGYGEWVRVDGLGQVWRPWVAAGWQPYTHGRWVWTSLGWTWVAYEPWGWVPHHYGNWAFSTIGWVWSPGYTYHPGNVVWVSSGANVGWYPCAPRGWSHFYRGAPRGWNAGYVTGRSDGYASGYADGWLDARYATWVPWSRLDADNVSRYAVGAAAATHGAARAGVVAMTAPPTRSDVERRIGRPIPEARIVERNATVDGHRVRFVRPEGQEKEVMRHGTETINRALAPAARTRVNGDTRRGDRPQTDPAPAARRPEPAVKADRTLSNGAVRHRGSSSPTQSRPSRSVESQPEARPRTGQSRSLDRSLRGPASPKAGSAAATPRQTAGRAPGRALAASSPVPARSAPRGLTPTIRSSSRPPITASAAERVRSEPRSGKALDAPRSGSRSKSTPAKTQPQKARRGKN